MPEQTGLQAVLDDDDFNKGLNNVVKGYDKLTKESDKAAKASTKSMTGLASVLGTAVGTAVGHLAATEIPKLIGSVGGMIKSAAEAEEIGAALSAVLKSTSGAAGVTEDMANDLANSLSLLTTYEDDTIVAAETMLLRFKGIGKDIFPDVTRATLDVATALKMDLGSAAKLVGKAIDDPSEGLTRLKAAGLNLSDSQEKVIKQLVATGQTAQAQRLVLDELTKSVGGAAQAAGSTFTGQLTILQNALGNIGEEVGTAFLPILKGATSLAIEALPVIKTFVGDVATAFKTGDFSKIGETVATAFGNLVTMAATKLGELLSNFRTWTTSNRPQLEKLGSDIGDFIVSSIAALFSKDKSGEMNGLQQALSDAAEGAGTLLSAVGRKIAEKILAGMVEFLQSNEFKQALVKAAFGEGNVLLMQGMSQWIDNLFRRVTPSDTMIGTGSAMGGSGGGTAATWETMWLDMRNVAETTTQTIGSTVQQWQDQMRFNTLSFALQVQNIWLTMFNVLSSTASVMLAMISMRFNSAFQNIASQAANYGNQAVGNMANAINSGGWQLYNAGQNMVNHIINGIWSRYGDLQNAINAMNNASSGLSWGNPNYMGRAFGGPVSAGQRYRFNEMGPGETFVPYADGWVFPNQHTVNMFPSFYPQFSLPRQQQQSERVHVTAEVIPSALDQFVRLHIDTYNESGYGE